MCMNMSIEGALQSIYNMLSHRITGSRTPGMLWSGFDVVATTWCKTVSGDLMVARGL